MLVETIPFAPAHYAAFTRLWNEAYPELKRSELEWRLADLKPARDAAPRRWIATIDGEVVAFAGFEELAGELWHPRKFQLHLLVVPEYRRRGIGAALYEQVAERLRSIDALAVRAWVREDRIEGLRFLSTRGFVAEMRTHHSALATTGFDLSRLKRHVLRLNKRDYQFLAFDELANDPDRNRKAYELYCAVMHDIPAAEPPRLPAFSEYEQRIGARPDAFRTHLLAVHRAQYVGLCILLPKDRARRELYADTLGVKHEYRGRGIAQALACAGIEYAQSHGYATISADNFVENRAIIPLLDNLGFANRSDWTLFVKSLAADRYATRGFTAS